MKENLGTVTLQARDLRNGMLVSVEQVQECAFGRGKEIQGLVEKFDLPPEVEIVFEIGSLGNRSFVDRPNIRR